MYEARTLTLFLFIISSFFMQAKAQEADTDNQSVRELGVGVRNFSEDFSLIYKKQIGENKYRRYDGSLSLALNSDRRFLGMSFSIGTEKRKYLDEKLKFVRGPGFGLSVLSDFEEGGLTRFIPFINYQLGIQYDIKENFYVGASTFPNFTLNISSDEEFPLGFGLNANLSAQVSAIFRF